MSQINPAELPSIVLDSTRPAENAPVPLGITQPPSSATKPAISKTTQPAGTVSAPVALVDSTGHFRTTPAASVVLETRYRNNMPGDTLSFLVPLRELLSWRALKVVLASIRESNPKMPPIIYYCGTVVIGKYWPDIIHDGAKFVAIYTHEYEFDKKAGTPYCKYWVTE